MSSDFYCSITLIVVMVNYSVGILTVQEANVLQSRWYKSLLTLYYKAFTFISLA